MNVDPVALGRQFVAEMRQGVPASADDDDNEAEESANDLMCFGAKELDDETLWLAVMTAVELAADDGERWVLGDTLIDESIATRPHLQARWRESYSTNDAVRQVYRVMHEPRWNWGYDDSDDESPAGWWSEGAWWAEVKAARRL